MIPRPLGWVRAEVDHLRAACEWGLAEELLRLVCVCARRRAPQEADAAQLARIRPLIEDGVILVIDGKIIPAMVVESMEYAGKQSAAGAASAAKRKEAPATPPQAPAPPPAESPVAKPKATAKKAAEAPTDLPEWVPATAFAEFMESRRLLKRPMTALAVRQTLAKLEEFSGRDSQTAAEILTNSIANGWQGIFPIKQAGRAGRPAGPSTSFDHSQAEDILTHRGSG